MVWPFPQWETVVVGQFLPREDFPPGDNPDSTADDLDGAVRRTGVIDPSRDIAAGGPVDVMAPADVENVDAPVAPASQSRPAPFLPAPRLGFADPFANVF